MATVTGTQRTAEVTWSGDLLNGSGVIESVGSGAFGPLDVTWKARAEEPDGLTSPEELIAAAHSACFSMALAGALAKGDTPPEHLSTTARITFVPGTGHRPRRRGRRPGDRRPRFPAGGRAGEGKLPRVAGGLRQRGANRHRAAS
jgi:hypothetical protein